MKNLIVEKIREGSNWHRKREEEYYRSIGVVSFETKAIISRKEI